MRAELLDALIQTLDDKRVSRGERRALREVIADEPLSTHERVTLVSALFGEVGDRMKDPRDRELVAWLRDAVGLLRPAESGPEPARVLFGPSDPMVETLLELLSETRTSFDLAVFTLTDDRLAAAILDLHRSGIAVRILTDDDKASDLGSDVRELVRAGVPLRTDRSEYHFHHKFAVFDRKRVVTGSYNWTRGADRNNRENFLITEDLPLVAGYSDAFDAMWEELG